MGASQFSAMALGGQVAAAIGCREDNLLVSYEAERREEMKSFEMYRLSRVPGSDSQASA